MSYAISENDFRTFREISNLYDNINDLFWTALNNSLLIFFNIIFLDI